MYLHNSISQLLRWCIVSYVYRRFSIMASEIKVDTIVNAGGDNDTGIDLATNDNIKFNIAGSRMLIDS